MDAYDAIVIGGGPAGSTVASSMARAGRRVLLLEKEKFPRFHVGESLLPYIEPIFDELGLRPRLEAAGFLVKHGAQFHVANGSKSLFLQFRNGCFTRHAVALQVERSKFDQLLLDHARDQGADIREGWTVRRFTTEPSRVCVSAEGPDGAPAEFHGRFLIDASGRGNVTGNQEGLREIHPRLKKLAVFGHFNGVRLDPGEQGGDTVIVRLENKWFWIIPLSPEKISVGCVLDRDEFAAGGGSAAEIFTRLWQSSPVLRERMCHARLLGEMHVTSDFSYRNRRLTGPRLLRVGDAAGFMDPIFSAGVYLAMYSGRLAARLVDDALRAGHDGSRQMPAYEKKIRRSMGLYWKMVEGYYTRPFLDLFMNPRNRLDLPSAVTALLAGELDGGWKVRWRMWVFFLLVKLQKRFHLLPPVSFAPVPGPAAGSVPHTAPAEAAPEMAHGTGR